MLYNPPELTHSYNGECDNDLQQSAPWFHKVSKQNVA